MIINTVGEATYRMNGAIAIHLYKGDYEGRDALSRYFWSGKLSEARAKRRDLLDLEYNRCSIYDGDVYFDVGAVPTKHPLV